MSTDNGYDSALREDGAEVCQTLGLSTPEVFQLRSDVQELGAKASGTHLRCGPRPSMIRRGLREPQRPSA